MCLHCRALAKCAVYQRSLMDSVARHCVDPSVLFTLLPQHISNILWVGGPTGRSTLDHLQLLTVNAAGQVRADA
jgi:hypothetical protein